MDSSICAQFTEHGRDTSRYLQDLYKSALSVRRSKNNFARTTVDMTLEETINADAASGLTGISAFQQSYVAKKPDGPLLNLQEVL